MKILKKDLIDEHSLFHSLILSSLKDSHMKTLDLQNKSQIEFKLTIEGLELNPREYFADMQRRFDERVEEAAKEMVMEKHKEVMKTLGNLQDIITDHTDKIIKEAGVTSQDD